MTKPIDRTAFLSEPTRLRVAELCRYEELSQSEIAARLDRRPGSLSQPKTMRERRALLTGRRKSSDGRGPVMVYRLNPDWEEALEEAQRQQRPSWARMSRDLLLVPLSETPTACAAIAAGIDEIEWGARVSGERTGLILAPELDPSGASTIRVVRALSAVGQVMHLHLDDAMSPSELRAWSNKVIVAGGPIGELPPSS